jgi:hypothetical protein
VNFMRSRLNLRPCFLDPKGVALTGAIPERAVGSMCPAALFDVGAQLRVAANVSASGGKAGRGAACLSAGSCTVFAPDRRAS